jgi:hypothetical protein
MFLILTPEVIRRHYEGPLTEVLLKIQWMIEKLIQDNVVVLRTVHLFCQKIKLVLLRDEVKVLQVLDLLARKLLNSLFTNGIAR